MNYAKLLSQKFVLAVFIFPSRRPCSMRWFGRRITLFRKFEHTVGSEASQGMSVPKRIGEVELADWQGDSRVLESYWEAGPVVLAFIRHFG